MNNSTETVEVMRVTRDTRMLKWRFFVTIRQGRGGEIQVNGLTWRGGTGGDIFLGTPHAQGNQVIHGQAWRR